jgi:hypothetical protein
MTAPNRRQRRSVRAEPLVLERTDEPEPIAPAAPTKRPWHLGPKVDRILYFANLTPQGCGLVLLFVATLSVLAMAIAAWIR